MEVHTEYCSTRSSLEQRRLKLVSRLSDLTTGLTKLVGQTMRIFLRRRPNVSAHALSSPTYSGRFEPIGLSTDANRALRLIEASTFEAFLRVCEAPIFFRKQLRVVPQICSANGLGSLKKHATFFSSSSSWGEPGS